MKVIVVSDSHGKNSRLDEVLMLEPKADYYLHCGDIEASEDAYPMYQTVQGNNDYFCSYPDHLKIKVAEHQILVMHGNQFPYMKRIERMAEYARQQHCDIFCFGHTHVAMIEKVNGILMLNPGSLWRSRDGRGPSYAVMNIEEQDVQAEIKFLD